MSQNAPRTAKTRTVLSIKELEALNAESQSSYCTNIVGNDVAEAEVEGLLYLAEFGKTPHAPMWAVFALGRAGSFAALVLPKLVELLNRDTNSGRFRGNLAEAIGKLPSAVNEVGLLFRHYHDTRLETEYRGVFGCAIARIFSDPTTEIEASAAQLWIGTPLGEESPACAVLRYLIDRPVHTSVVEAALKALLQHLPANFRAARPAIEAAARCRHSESIAKAGNTLLAVI